VVLEIYGGRTRVRSGPHRISQPKIKSDGSAGRPILFFG
jgi:hypothetical protein